MQYSNVYIREYSEKLQIKQPEDLIGLWFKIRNLYAVISYVQTLITAVKIKSQLLFITEIIRNPNIKRL